MIKSDIHVFTGMLKDLAISRLAPLYLWDANNIRITAKENETLLSITNEIGPAKLSILNEEDGKSLLMEGNYIGHCIINNYLVIFTHVDSSDDRIYRIDTESRVGVLLFSEKSLNLSLDYPIKAISIYENKNIQKIYWTDNKNLPRVINIKKAELLGKSVWEVRENYTSTSFDFVLPATLKDTIQVEKVSGNGSFPAGTILYAYTYFNKYGLETNIINCSERNYIAPTNRGGNPEEVINNAFKINITNTDTSFDYIRIYSILRTSMDGTPLVKRIADIKSDDLKIETIETVIATNGRYEATDPTEEPEKVPYSLTTDKYLLINGSDSILVDSIPRSSKYSLYIVTSTYSGKLVRWLVLDKTIFPEIQITVTNDLYGKTRYTYGPDTNYIAVSLDTIHAALVAGYYMAGFKEYPTDFTTHSEALLYGYSGTIQYVYTPVTITTTVNKGIEFTDNNTTGETVDPTYLFYVGGEELIANTFTNKDNTLFIGNILLKRTALSSIIKESIKALLPTEGHREIEYNNTSNPAYYLYQSPLDKNDTSYFKRGEWYRLGLLFQHITGKWSEPLWILDYTVTGYPRLDKENLSVPTIKVSIPTNITGEAYSNNYLRVRPVVVFPSINDRKVVTLGILCPTMFNTDERCLNAPFAVSSWFSRLTLATEDTLSELEYSTEGYIPRFKHFDSVEGEDTVSGSKVPEPYDFAREGVPYKIDLSILTMHSPDIEWDSSIYSIDNQQFKCDIVGLASFTSSISDFDLDTATPSVYGGNAISINEKCAIQGDSTDAARSKISLLYTDGTLLYYDKDTGEIYCYGHTTQTPGYVNPTNYIVDLWLSNGSLNNDSGENPLHARTSELKLKIISNLKFSRYSLFFKNPETICSNGITPVRVFDRDNQLYVLIPCPENSGYTNDLLYQGNVNTAVDNNGILEVYTDPSSGSRTIRRIPTSYDNMIESYKSRKELFNIKYKSSNHLVFSLNYNDKGSYNILPTLNGKNKIDKIDSTPEWMTTDVTVTGTLPVNNPTYKGTTFPSSSELGMVIWLVGQYSGIWVLKDTAYTEDTWKTLTFEGVMDYWTKYPLEAGTTFEYSGQSYIWTGKEFKSYTSESEVASKTTINLPDYTFEETEDLKFPYLLIGELKRDESEILNAFGGDSETALLANKWLPAGKAVSIDLTNPTEVEFIWGDTWYSRYDCLKTYAYTSEDKTLLIEIMSFMCESRVNPDGRYDLNRGKTSNLYMSPQNFNLFNSVYTLKNNYFTYNIFDLDYYNLQSFPNLISWTKEKLLGSDIDTWTLLPLSSIYNMNGEAGEITDLQTWKDNIYCFLTNGISQILFNSRVLIPVSDGVPVEISNSYKLEGKRYLSNNMGSINKFSIANTNSGIYFIDSISRELYLLSENGFNNISKTKNMSAWFNKLEQKEWTPNEYTTKLFLDLTNGDLYITTGDTALYYSEQLQEFVSFVSYEDTPAMFNNNYNFYCFHDTALYLLWKGAPNLFFGTYQPYNLTFICNGTGSENLSQYDKIFNNIDFRADTWEDYIEGTLSDKQPFDYIKVWNEYLDTEEVPLSTSGVSSDGSSSVNHPSNLKKKFRTWRIQIPRNKKLDSKGKGGRDRIRNLWVKIKLGINNDDSIQNENVLLFHDARIIYFI